MTGPQTSSPAFRPAAVTLSEAAAARVRRVAGEAGVDHLVLRLKPSGCSGFKYEMSPAAAAPANAAGVACAPAWLVLDPASELFLFGARIDVAGDAFGERFVFDNPNETSACGCGLSVGF